MSEAVMDAIEQHPERVFTACWVGIFGAFGVVEAWAIHRRNHGSLSDHMIRWWRLKTPRGKVAFLLAWAIFAVWFPWHLFTEKAVPWSTWPNQP